MSGQIITREEVEALQRPFRENIVKFRAGSVYPRQDPTRAQALAYIESRDAMQRLDEVFPGEWEFRWEGDGPNVHGNLIIRGIGREDVGEPGEGEYGNTRKAAVSDALKRCAVQWGIGRYLYYLPRVWVGYDAKRKELAELPRLPSWATPEGWDAQRAQAEADQEIGRPAESGERVQQDQPARNVARPAQSSTATAGAPVTYGEGVQATVRAIQDKAAQLAAQGYTSNNLEKYQKATQGNMIEALLSQGYGREDAEVGAHAAISVIYGAGHFGELTAPQCSALGRWIQTKTETGYAMNPRSASELGTLVKAIDAGVFDKAEGEPEPESENVPY